MNRASALLFLILALSGLLALGYSAATPFGKNPDEAAHFEYVRILATEGRLPVLNLEQRRASPETDLNYEAHQAPLYYALAVPFFHAGRLAGGDPGAQHAVRLLSILIGLVGTWLIWLLARRLAPDRPALWTAAAGFAAFLPMRQAIMASASNDLLAEAASTLALLLMVRMASAGAPSAAGGPGSRAFLGSAAALGAALGLALLSKQREIVLLPAALVAVYFATRAVPRAAGTPEREAPSEEESARRFVLGVGVVFGAAALMAGWWYLRNHLLYGDPMAQRVFNWYFEDTPRWAHFRDMGWSYGAFLGQLVLPTTFASFWGAFGHMEVFMGAYGRGYPPPSWVYPLLQAAVLLSAAGGLRAWFSRRGTAAGERTRPRHREEKGRKGEERQKLAPAAPRPTRVRSPAVAVLALHALFVFAAFMNFNATYFQAQGRYLFPAIAAISLALAGGWLAWAGKREAVGAWVVVGGTALLSAYALFGVVVPAFR